TISNGGVLVVEDRRCQLLPPGARLVVDAVGRVGYEDVSFEPCELLEAVAVVELHVIVFVVQAHAALRWQSQARANPQGSSPNARVPRRQRAQQTRIDSFISTATSLPSSRTTTLQ